MNDKDALIQYLKEQRAAIDRFFENIAAPPVEPLQPQTAPKPQTSPLPVTEQIAKRFPPELRELLSFEDTPKYVVIRPQKWLGTENFAAVGAIIRESDGEYISAGKASHFRILKKETG